MGKRWIKRGLPESFMSGCLAQPGEHDDPKLQNHSRNRENSFQKLERASQKPERASQNPEQSYRKREGASQNPEQAYRKCERAFFLTNGPSFECRKNTQSLKQHHSPKKWSKNATKTPVTPTNCQKTPTRHPHDARRTHLAANPADSVRAVFIADCGLRISDCGSRIAAPRPICRKASPPSLLRFFAVKTLAAKPPPAIRPLHRNR